MLEIRRQRAAGAGKHRFDRFEHAAGVSGGGGRGFRRQGEQALDVLADPRKHFADLLGGAHGLAARVGQIDLRQFLLVDPSRAGGADAQFFPQLAEVGGGVLVILLDAVERGFLGVAEMLRGGFGAAEKGFHLQEGFDGFGRDRADHRRPAGRAGIGEGVAQGFLDAGKGFRQVVGGQFDADQTGEESRDRRMLHRQKGDADRQRQHVEHSRQGGDKRQHRAEHAGELQHQPDHQQLPAGEVGAKQPVEDIGDHLGAALDGFPGRQQAVPRALDRLPAVLLLGLDPDPRVGDRLFEQAPRFGHPGGRADGLGANPAVAVDEGRLDRDPQRPGRGFQAVEGPGLPCRVAGKQRLGVIEGGARHRADRAEHFPRGGRDRRHGEAQARRDGLGAFEQFAPERDDRERQRGEIGAKQQREGDHGRADLQPGGSGHQFQPIHHRRHRPLERGEGPGEAGEGVERRRAHGAIGGARHRDDAGESRGGKIGHAGESLRRGGFPAG